MELDQMKRNLDNLSFLLSENGFKIAPNIYRCGNSFIETWLKGGKKIMVQIYDNENGYDVLIGATQENSIQATYNAIKRYARAEVSK